MHPRVLLVEDDSVISFLVEEILVELGLDVVAAGDAAGALAAVGGRRFDLAVIDLGLPDGTGHAVVRAARALSVPVIVSSGDDLRPEDLERAAGIGEAPVGLQGTFSLWDSSRALRDFAYASPAHQRVVAETAPARWYAEELFARFAVEAADGSVDGRDPLA